jgi:uncharacterized membrane protein YqjE
MMGGVGVVGTTIWIAWSIGIVWLLFNKRRWKQKNAPMVPFYFAQAMVCAWLVFHLNGLTQVNMWEAKVQHQIAWIIAWCLL